MKLARHTGSARALGLVAAGLCLSLAGCQEPSVGARDTSAAAIVGPRIVLEDAWVDLHGHVVATFAATQAELPLSLDEMKALSPRFTLATLTDHPVDGLRAWKSQLLTGSQTAAALPPGGPGTPASAILTSARQPGSETPATFVDLGGGRYRYVFANPLTGFDPDETVRVGAWLSAATSPSLDTASTFDFRPSGGPVEERDVVTDEGCARCHGTLVLHGTRTRVRLCVTCHTWQAADPDTIDPASMSATATTDPNPLDLGRLVHRIHRGKQLPTLYRSSSSVVDPDPLNTTANLPLPFSPENSTTAIVGRKYSIVGFRSHEVVYGRVLQRADNAQAPRTVAAGVVFPRDLRDCEVCHDEGAPQRDERVNAISRRTCSGCHPDIWFGSTPITDESHLAHAGGPLGDDSECKGCHVDPAGTSAPKLYAPISGPSSAHVPIAKSERHNMPIVEIVSITGLVPGGAPVIRFKLRDRAGFIGPTPGAPVPPTEAASATSSPVSRALSSVGIRITGPGAITGSGSSDYTSSGFPITSGSSGNPNARLLTATSGIDPEYVYTFVSTIPATATGSWLVVMEARRSLKVVPHYTKDAGGKPDAFNWPYTGETVNETAENPIAYVDTATGTWPPDGPAPRRNVVSQEKCLRCHGRLEFHGGGARHEVALCLTCHTPDKTDYAARPKASGFVNLGATFDGLEERSIQLKVMIHRIHTGGRTGAASLEGIEPHVVYGYGGTPYFFDEGIFPRDLRDCTLCHEGKSYLLENVPADAPPTVANETATIRHQASAAAHSAGEPSTPPIQAACTSCHATGATLDHVAAKTVGGVETCASCHAKGALSVEVAHGLAPPAGGAGSTFSSIVQAVIVPRCATAACHSGNPPVAFPQLDADVAHASMVGVTSPQAGIPIVDPNAPENSYLLAKLRGDSGIVGQPMPTDGLLDAADVAAIEAWIANGAPND